MAISPKRELLFKLTIVTFFTFVFLLITATLIYTGVIRFNWSDQIMARWAYDEGKTKDQRILILGDSQLTWWNLDHCLFEDIRQFCKAHDLGYVNAAKGGNGPIEYLDRMQAIGPDYKPNLVILFYYAGNDLTDVMYRSNQRPKEPGLNWIKQLNFKDEDFAKAREVDAFSTKRPNLETDQKQEILRGYDFDWEEFARKGIDSTMIAYAKNRLYYPGKIGAEYVNPHILVMGSWKPDYLYDNNQMDSPESEAAWSVVANQLDAIKAVTSEIGAELRLVCIPSTVQVDSSHFDFYRKLTFRVGEALVSARAPQDRLTTWAALAKVPFVDLLPIFKAHPNPATLYFENDDHLSNEGHLEAYNRVRQEILEPFVRFDD
ncbi:MAG: hypothetical protein AAFO02_12575 [Bacteroidota bacterium]